MPAFLPRWRERASPSPPEPKGRALLPVRKEEEEEDLGLGPLLLKETKPLSPPMLPLSPLLMLQKLAELELRGRPCPLLLPPSSSLPLFLPLV